MIKYLFAKDYLAAGLCLFVSVSGFEPLCAQDVPRTEGATATRACAGVLCALTPGSMERPILADEAKKIEATRLEAARDVPLGPEVVAAPRGKNHIGKHQVAVAHSHQGRARIGRSVAARPNPTARGPIAPKPPAPGFSGSINEIFVIAPQPFDPYGGDYAAWLDRLAWPNRSDRAGDRAVFSVEGYLEPDTAPLLEASTPEADAAEDLSRRLDALSQRGFQAMKADSGG